MSKENLQSKTCKELRELAKGLNISGRWDMTKEQLIEAILGVENAMGSENKAVIGQSTNDECKVDNRANGSNVEAEVKIENESAGTGANIDQKMSYVERIEIGTIVAFRLSNGKSQQQHQQKSESIQNAQQPGTKISTVFFYIVNGIEARDKAVHTPAG